MHEYSVICIRPALCVVCGSWYLTVLCVCLSERERGGEKGRERGNEGRRGVEGERRERDTEKKKGERKEKRGDRKREEKKNVQV